MVFRIFFALLFASLLPCTGQGLSTIASQEKENRRSHFQTQASGAGQNFNVLHYRCEWAIDPAVRYISGRVRTTFRLTTDTTTQLVFDFYNGLTVDSVVFRGQKCPFSFPETHLFRIKTGSVINQNQIDSVSIYYRGVPDNSGFGAFNKQSHAGQPIIWTMSCPYASRDWWPCIQNLEDKADSIDLIITVPSNCRAAGNGALAAEIAHGNKKTFYWKHRYPIASYLVATAVTNYSAFTHKVHLPSQSPGDSLPVVNFVYPESLSGALTNAKKVLPILQYYDSLVAPYPFRKEKYGHAQFGWGGGMEHQTMSFMTNFSFDLQAHELAHQWFGDHITCRSWRDVWLNEGWATYLAALTGKRFGVASFSSWLTSTQNDVKTVAGGSVWVDDTTDINRVFDGRLTYEKGALVLHMLRWELGDEAFWQGVRSYQSDPQLKYGFASTARFIQHLETASGKNLTGFMADWFTGQGYPTYTLKLLRDGLQMKLTINQTSSHPSVSFFEMKVPVRFRATGFDTTLVFKQDTNGQVFNFTLPFTPTTVTFDPDKWLLAKSSVQVLTNRAGTLTFRNMISVYPNPFSDSFVVRNDSDLDLPVRVTNALGEEIGVYTVRPGIQQRLDLSEIPSGVYFLQLEKDGSVLTQKVVKE